VRRVWDTFTFNDELDLLEARLIELDSAVYRHVLVEAPLTHQGNPKPLWYEENKERFAPWKDKIIHVVADLEDCADDYDRELAQRKATREGLNGIREDDLFLTGDVDEIPRAEIVQLAEPGHVFVMRLHVMAVNLLELGYWNGTLAVSGIPPEIDRAIGAFQERHSKPSFPPLKQPIGWPLFAGWHFSWLGGPDAMRTKAHSFFHPEAIEFIDPHADYLYVNRISPATGAQTVLLEVVIDESFPRFMQERRGPASWYWPGA
jgi:glycosyl transferase family 17